jgi:hypothetical protein
MLIRLGADPNCSDLMHYHGVRIDKSSIGSALYQAVDAGPEFVKYLLDQGAEVPKHNSRWSRHSPLNRAATFPTPAILELFMDWYTKRDRQFPWGRVIAVPHASENNIVAILQREYHLWEYPPFSRTLVQKCCQEEVYKGDAFVD